MSEPERTLGEGPTREEIARKMFLAFYSGRWDTTPTCEVDRAVKYTAFHQIADAILALFAPHLTALTERVRELEGENKELSLDIDEAVREVSGLQVQLATTSRQLEEARGALTFDTVTAVSLARCNRWHKNGITDWSVADWAVAMAGEAGETCNAVKKLRRVEDEIANISDEGRLLATKGEAIAKIGEEIADTLLYLDLLACRLGLSLSDEVIRKFNRTSERYGFPERLPPPEARGGG